MNGNGTTQEPPDGGETAPAPPSWAHDFLPASCVFDCQGPECDAQAMAYWQNNVGYVAAGWQIVAARPYCSWLCVARYAALRAQEQVEVMHHEMAEATPSRSRRSRHN